MLKTKWILCDLGNTLVNFDHILAGKRLAEIAVTKYPDDAGKLPPLQRVFEFFFHQRDDEPSLNRQLDTGLCGVEKVVELFNREFGLAITIDDFIDAWQAVFTTTNPDVIDAMKRARAKGIRVAICSNTNRYHWEKILEDYPEIQGTYDDILMSYRLGCAKTDPEFFARVPHITGVKPEEHLFLDDLPTNIEAAQRAGIPALLFEGELPDHEAWS